MHAVEAMRAVQEVGRSLTGTTDAAHLDDLRRLKRQFVTNRYNLGRNRVVATAVAQRRFAAFVGGLFQADEIYLWGTGRCSRHVKLPFPECAGLSSERS